MEPPLICHKAFPRALNLEKVGCASLKRYQGLLSFLFGNLMPSYCQLRSTEDLGYQLLSVLFMDSHSLVGSKRQIMYLFGMIQRPDNS